MAFSHVLEMKVPKKASIYRGSHDLITSLFLHTSSECAHTLLSVVHVNNWPACKTGSSRKEDGSLRKQLLAFHPAALAESARMEELFLPQQKRRSSWIGLALQEVLGDV